MKLWTYLSCFTKGACQGPGWMELRQPISGKRGNNQTLLLQEIERNQKPRAFEQAVVRCDQITTLPTRPVSESSTASQGASANFSSSSSMRPSVDNDLAFFAVCHEAGGVEDYE